jgi:hypothetical protein
MTSVFIVRPFGKKTIINKGGDKEEKSFDVDFAEIDRLLVQPALARNRLDGQTTEAIAMAGNIRLDMFQMLIAYDLVIADISIDNANVFYELGIRHALRPNGTILIRFANEGKDVPFDLKTDRYVVYDRKDPAAAVERLARSIGDTISGMQDPDRTADSPVFLLLPELAPTDPARLMVVPKEFQEAVERAENDGSNGPATLALLREEAKRTAWAREGVRLVGRAQRRTRSFKAALASWAFIRKEIPDDVEANLQLATIFQRLGDLVSASQACRRVLALSSSDRKGRADARSQLARNEKASWVVGFSALDGEAARRRQAISDNRLIEAFGGYMAGFAEDLNDYYSGINAFGLLTAIVKLAEAEPNSWVGRFPAKRKADAALEDYREQLDYVRGAVWMSLENARQQAERSGRPDEWLPPSRAQYSLLTSDSVDFVRNAYQAARNAGSGGFSVESEAAQVRIFLLLGLFPDNCRAAMECLGVSSSAAGLEAADASTRTSPRDRVIVCSGHRVDGPTRASPRFPNTPECIAKAKSWLRARVEAERLETAGCIGGIGGAASGTDLLFHEVCDECGIPTTVVLPISKEAYCQRSVADGGPDWVERFNRLVSQAQTIILGDSAEMPAWTASIANYSVFQRGNIWVMENALLRPNADVTLLALWNGKAGDGPGGTSDMIELAKAHGAKVCTGDTNELFARS